MRHFDEELQELRNRLLGMGGLAEEMATVAVKGLVDRRDQLASIRAYEDRVDDLHVEIDETVVRLIALHHPVASDLRFLIMASKICGELERIADEALNVAKHTARYLEAPPLKPLLDLPIMGDIACRMLKDSLDAFTHADVALARKVCDADDTVDAYEHQIFRELLTYMMSEPASVPRALSLLLISRCLERIGDHATNIAEEAMYLVQGREVRHVPEDAKPGGRPDPAR
jgi:phosphate transport system protein